MIAIQTGQSPLPSLTSDLRPRRRLLRAEGCPPWLAGAIWRKRLTSGFTLIELLVVIAIMILVAAFIAPAFTTMRSAGDATSTVYNIGGVLEQARSYAIANNTYVWIGFKEVDASKDASVSPQATGVGRVAIAIVASKDGTRGYDATSSSLPNPAWVTYNNGANLV